MSRLQADLYQGTVARMRAVERMAESASSIVRNAASLLILVADDAGAYAINEYLWICDASDADLTKRYAEIVNVNLAIA